MTAIFLHSGWRTGSTYVWSKFREAPGTLAFYEPFHELLGTHAGRILTFRSDPETSHHPPLAQPYFAEYLPLIDGDGVRHFEAGFSYRRFFLDPEDSDPGLERYVGQLVELGAESGLIPVLGFSRSLGRAGWLKHRFESVNILVRRDPRAQWASILHQRNRHQLSYFLINQFLICGQNRDHPLIRPLIGVYDIPLVQTSSVNHDIAIYQRLFEEIGDSTGYLVFYYLWLVTQAQARPHADLVIDVDRLATDPAHRAATTEAIARETGLTLSFEDATVGHGIERPALDHAGIEDYVKTLVASTLMLPEEV